MNLSGAVPNLQFGLSNADSGVLISIRGVTSTNFTEIGDPAVGVHIDGMYSPRPQGSLALLFDLDQIEVLRGAQGTLFGRNSTAGVVNVLPARPDFKSNYGWTSLQLGNYRGRQLRSVYNLALGDNFALRAAVMVDRRDGYIRQERDLEDRGIKQPDGSFSPDGKPDKDQRLNRQLSPSDYYSNADQKAARITARWAISPSLEWTGAYEHYKNQGAGDVGLKDCEMAAGTRFACGPEGQWYARINVPGKIDMSIDTLRNALSWKLDANTELAYKLAYASQKRYQQHDDDGGQNWLPGDVGVMESWGNWGNQHGLDWASYTLASKYRSWVHELQLKQSFSSWRYVAGTVQPGGEERHRLCPGQSDRCTLRHAARPVLWPAGPASRFPCPVCSGRYLPGAEAECHGRHPLQPRPAQRPWRHQRRALGRQHTLVLPGQVQPAMRARLVHAAQRQRLDLGHGPFRGFGRLPFAGDQLA